VESGEEGIFEFIVVGGDPAGGFGFVEESLDAIALAIKLVVIRKFYRA